MTTIENQANEYLRTRVLTASPEELRLMLLDGALRFGHMGREGMVNQDYEAIYNGVSQCRAIVLELLTTINDAPDPKLAEQVKSVYLFLYSELAEVTFDRRLERMDKILELLEYERETWVLLMEQLKKERAAAGGGSPAPTPGDQPASGRPSLSIEA